MSIPDGWGGLTIIESTRSLLKFSAIIKVKFIQERI